MGDDYREQQEMEVEALQSIFMDDLEELSEGVPSGWRPAGTVYRVALAPQLEEALPEEYPLSAELVFAHTPTYPDEAPLFKARGLRGMADSDTAALQAVVDEQVELNLGMPMVYALVTAAQEWVNERGAAMARPAVDPEAEAKRAQAAEEERIAELRRHGTAVTPETFAVWQAAFEAESAMAKAAVADAAAASAAAAAAAGRGKLTGKQYFMQLEAAHLEVEEPELGEDEEDGAAGSRGSWSGSESGGEGAGTEEVEDSDDDALLDEYLMSKTAGT